MDNLYKMKRVMVIAPHPDDETLGCAGTLLRHKNMGDDIYWLIITNVNECQGWDKGFVDKRQDEIDQVSHSYGFKDVFKLDFPTTRLDDIPIAHIVASISRIVEQIKPDIAYLPNRMDIHTDHQICFKAALSCLKSFRAQSVKRMLMYETLSETEFAPPLPEAAFTPNVFVDITLHIKKKLEIFSLYASEVMDQSFPRSLESIQCLARYRGNRIGVGYAEAFMLIQEII